MPETATASAAPACIGDASQPPSSVDVSSALSLIEQLGHLKEKGLLTEEEFAAKKAELLKRL